MNLRGKQEGDVTFIKAMEKNDEKVRLKVIHRSEGFNGLHIHCRRENKLTIWKAHNVDLTLKIKYNDRKWVKM